MAAGGCGVSSIEYTMHVSVTDNVQEGYVTDLEHCVV